MKLLLTIVLLIIVLSTHAQDIFGNRLYFKLIQNNNSDDTVRLDHIVFNDSLLLIRMRCPKNNFEKNDTVLKFKIFNNNDTVSFVEATLGLIAKATLVDDTLTFFMGIPIFMEGCSYVKKNIMSNEILNEDIEGFERKDRPPPPHPGYLLGGSYQMQQKGSVVLFTNHDLSFTLLSSGSFVTTFCGKIVFKGTYKIKGTGFILSEKHFKFRLVKDKELYYIKRFN